MADCACLENRRPFTGSVGSNPTSSASLNFGCSCEQMQQLVERLVGSPFDTD